MIFNYVDGAASDKKAAKLNVDRLSDLRLMPRVLRNVGARRLTGQILGMEVGLPFGIAPMGMCNLSWPGGDRALARLATNNLFLLLMCRYCRCVTASEAQVLAIHRAWMLPRSWIMPVTRTG